MNRDLNIQNELLEIAPVLSQCNRAMPYHLPEMYFTELETSVLDNCGIEKISKNPYNAPKGYFNDLSKCTIERILVQETAWESNEEEELKSIAPLLHTLPKTQVYQLPEGYFQQFTVKPETSKKAKVVSMHKIGVWMRYAALVGAIVVLVKLFVPFTKSADALPGGTPVALQQVPASEIEDYLADHATTNYSLNQAANDLNVENDVLLENVTEEEITQFLQDNATESVMTKKDI
jgi:hypothetical protein